MFDGQTTSEEVIAAFKPEIKGKTYVLIGAGYPSIGSQMATYLAQGSPAHIVIASRTASKVEPVVAKIREIDSGIKTIFVQVDVTDHSSVRRAAGEILEATKEKGIDVLVHTAGAMAIKNYTLDKQGIEYQLSTNHVGGFLLVNLLVPGLLTAVAAASSSGKGGARFVILTSSGYRLTPFRFDDYNFSNGEKYEPWTAYGQGKTANILFAHGLGKRLREKGVVAAAVHPGYNGNTKLGEHLTWDDYAVIGDIMKRNRGIDWEVSYDLPCQIFRFFLSYLELFACYGLAGGLDGCLVISTATRGTTEDLTTYLISLSLLYPTSPHSTARRR